MDELRSPVINLATRGARWSGVSLLSLVVASLALFASLNASRTRHAPLSNTLSSPEAVAEAVMDAVRAGDRDRLEALALTEEEFRSHVWRDLPASRPERNVPFDFVWDTLQQNSHGHLQQTLAGFRGVPLELRRVEFAGETSTYGDVVVRRDTELVVATTDGPERVVRLFGSMIEKDGAWKVFSYVVDD